MTADGYCILKIDDVIYAKYKIKDIIGKGMYGEVFRVEEIATLEKLALKVIKGIDKYKRSAESELDILKVLRYHDVEGTQGCITLLQDFNHGNHVCMLFPIYGPSLFEFLRLNSYQPYPLFQIQSICQQLLKAIAFIHSLNIIHTDIKPENILFVHDQFTVEQNSSTLGHYRLMNNTKIVLIDFGTAVYNSQHNYQSIVSTRYYRPPEVILKLGWTFACDIWAVGCISVELFTGKLLFKTHDDIEHLALMEKILGAFP
ncbi:kinase-like protein, partial [Rozella allomycis CSF55]